MPSRSSMLPEVDARLAIATLGVTAIIVYGSLFPFHFETAAIPGGPLRALLDTSPIADDRSDTLANFLLYIPLGLFGGRALRTYPRWTVSTIIIVVGFVLSMCMEMTQFYVPGRDPSMGDVWANTFGTVAGALAAACLKRDLTPGPRVSVAGLELCWRPFATLLIACWIGCQFFPYILGSSIQLHWSPSRILAGSLTPFDFCKQTMYWLAIAAILEAIFDARRSRLVLVLMAAAVLLAHVFLIDGDFPISPVAGGVVAVLAWTAISRWERRAGIVAILFVTLVILLALDPFRFLPSPREFGWIPFASFITGSRESGVGVFFEKAFVYGSLLWLSVRAGMSLAIATIAGATLVFCLRLAQVYLPGRSAEITDAVMVMMLGGLMYLVREPVP